MKPLSEDIRGHSVYVGRTKINEWAGRAAGLEAKIDALMLEYCPDEMTPEQLEEWGRNQRPAQEDV